MQTSSNTPTDPLAQHLKQWLQRHWIIISPLLAGIPIFVLLNTLPAPLP